MERVPEHGEDSEMPTGVVVTVDDSPRSEDQIRYRAMVLTYEYLFDSNDLQDNYQKAKRLVQKHNHIISDDEFSFHLGEIVYLHRKRQEPAYNTKLDEFVSSAKVAAQQVGSIWEGLAQLDHGYREIVLAIASRSISPSVVTMPSGVLKRRAQLAKLIAIAEHITSAFHQAAAAGVVLIRDTPSPTKPKTRYTFEAYKLSELWFFFTGEQVVYPRPVEGEASPHDSTEFVRLGIKMIDPKSKRAQADTSMKHARDYKKDYEELILGDASGDGAKIIEFLQGLLD
jgi:hypothetical protein